MVGTRLRCKRKEGHDAKSKMFPTQAECPRNVERAREAKSVSLGPRAREAEEALEKLGWLAVKG